ncbi:MAG: two-component system chemotaxis response regulator CheY [Pseudoalteromonas tetraodonis]|jgi:two-component system chemotaxis response regulator CheY|uniref:Response regulator n=1 Tax=Pseudoalteromonas sp. SD03 TaxID=3231719 RepID=A0AB39AW80_9GAMM|nr:MULTISPECIES: response regulator [unclassified Pseudoalteromonas]MAY58349.1 response regulator [Pseudoalteromonas sp.]ADT70466.1 response regulator receiver domain protein (CheY-like) [Pseudoalteromonas sp. SM9913]KGJ98228.1 response regulator receiver protein [Pseudoalteromonas sp. ND6B]MCK8104218.1 response regulator [Pseudoalteromonas sp. 2CM36K]MDN3400181.1 response regulator [Pseudoalteromonas sp. APC 3213]|tara:strand:+ start:327 stop:695 length:369 start_codon:yes stop_codon:yes gene_type:complete
MKILVVDDMPLMRHVLINMLRQLDYKDIVEATDGLQALNILQNQMFDLVITDLHMPKMDGITLLDNIRKDAELKNLPVLMVTCEDSSSTVKKAINAKVSGFIVKPFNMNVLSAQLTRLSIKA